MKFPINFNRGIRKCSFLIFLLGCISMLCFMVDLDRSWKPRFEENIVYDANSSDFENFSLDELQDDLIQCLAESENNYISLRHASRVRRSRNVEFNNSSTRIKDEEGGIKKPILYSLKDLNGLLKSADVNIAVLEPSILFCMLSDDQKWLLLRRKFNESKYLNGKKVIAFGVLSKDIAALSEEDNLERFLKGGLQLLFIKDLVPNWMRNENSLPKNETKFVSHILGWYYGYLLHFVVFYERASYLWHSHLDVQYLSEIPPRKEFHFVEHNSAYEKFKFVSLGAKDSRFDHFHIPSNPHFFLFEIGSSRFLECDLSRAANMNLSGQPKQHPSLTVGHFNKRTLIAMKEMKNIFTPLLMHYWIWSGTMLGWYRQCDVIPYTTDVDYGVWADEVDNLYTLIGLFTENSHLKIKQRMGLVEHALEFQLNCHDLRVDVFFLYQENNGTWYAGHKPSEGYFFKYHHPNFTLCSGELLGEKVTVPCETEKVIVAEYGPGWSHPVSSWNYESSIKNRGPNIYWEKDLRKGAYKNF